MAGYLASQTDKSHPNGGIVTAAREGRGLKSMPQPGQYSGGTAMIFPRPGRFEAELPPSFRKGFTLLEVLFAVVILGFGCMAALSLISSSISGNALASNNSMASFLAESQAEWIRSLNFNEVPFVSGTIDKLSAQGQNCEPDCIYDSPPCEPPVCYYTRTTTVTAAYPTSLSHEVSIKLEWASDRNHEFVYDTVITDFSFN